MTERTISTAERKKIITEFLQHCNDYSDAMLKKYEQQLTDEQTQDSAPQKIHNWNVYKEFNQYAIKELKGTELDDWFA